MSINNDENWTPFFDEEYWEKLYRRTERMQDPPVGELPSSADFGDTPEEVAEVPVLTEEFWERVSRRARRIRKLAVGELLSSEELGDRPEEVAEVPMLGKEFWEGVYRRAARIRKLPVGELLGSEELQDVDESDQTAVVFPWMLSRHGRGRADHVQRGPAAQRPPQ